ncbi:hypothetical protein HYFRA_00010722 [Hymenoscyphus fraxineus]|uniref:Peptide hydrolase n=1 Tax=Hymenoscyphus fraxineus TaxID=746836 RepID=A0A9N9L0L9_9HELO|nr:hypothetical protein HYFRA_00010722 [Hymenoscyphus fraxineus]
MKTFSKLAALAALAASIAYATPHLRDLPIVESSQLRSALTRSELLAKAQILEDFAYNTTERNRAIFSPGHKATYEYIYKFIQDLGDYYDVEYNEFTAESSSGKASVDGVPIASASPMTYTASGVVTGKVVQVANLGCDAADYPAEVSGSVALIIRGTCTFGAKAKLAGQAGAIGTIIYNNVPGAFGGTLGGDDPDFVPTVGITDVDGLALVAAIGNGTKTATLDVLVTQLPTYNVIAQTKGGDQENVLTIGAHSDSVPAGPGINDNGSGSVTLLEIAKQLTAFKTNNAVRFGWWSAEEVGLVGSTRYVEGLSPEELAKIKLYLNFDMLASPNYVYAIYDGDGSAFNTSGPPGSDAAEHLFEEYFKNEANLPFVPTEFDSRSDYAAFAAAGIPVGGLFTGAEVQKTEEEAALFGGQAGVSYDANYHLAGDNVANLDMDAWIENSKAVAHAVATYATSFESLGNENSIVGPERAQWRQKLPAGEPVAAHRIGGCSHSHDNDVEI